ncbi:MAG TPA: PaaX family transcriptional regulator C-terminal domain-containing protein [Acidimicrobiales bacterium]|jgi:phenylacetic acid degradation operon negative regulatory protein|nr:PaaX family transcriptional regulator C-terminal domain-containing protein [Acidimicrobiales bacterium]
MSSISASDRLATLTPRARSLNQGVPSARSLLLTVLGEWVLPSGGEAWTSALIDAMAAVGVESKTTRQAVARSAASGLLAPRRLGRRTRWGLTAEATRLLTVGTERIYSFGCTSPDWDGRWMLLITPAPEASRHLRHRVRTRLGWAGFAPIGPGTWLCPWVDREPEALAVLSDLDLARATRSFVGELGSIGDARTMVAEAWALEQVEKEYEAFVDAHGTEVPATPAEAFRALTLLVHEWRHFPSADPGLPAELLPQGWGGRPAAQLFHTLHERWAPEAAKWWTERL